MVNTANSPTESQLQEFDDIAEKSEVSEDGSPKAKLGVEVFIGGLLRTINRSILTKIIYSPVEEIIEINLAREKGKRRCRGYGFVRFRTSEQADSALQRCQEIEFQKGCFLRMMPSDENRTLFVGGINEDWPANKVCEFFHSSMRNVKRVGPVLQKEFPNRIRPFCFVEFHSHNDAKVAMYSHFKNVLYQNNGQEEDSNKFTSCASQIGNAMHTVSNPPKCKQNELSVAWAEPLRYYIHLFGRLGAEIDRIDSPTTEQKQDKNSRRSNSVTNLGKISAHKSNSSRNIAAACMNQERLLFQQKIIEESMFKAFGHDNKNSQFCYPSTTQNFMPVRYCEQQIQPSHFSHPVTTRISGIIPYNNLFNRDSTEEPFHYKRSGEQNCQYQYVSMQFKTNRQSLVSYNSFMGHGPDTIVGNRFLSGTNNKYLGQQQLPNDIIDPHVHFPCATIDGTKLEALLKRSCHCNSLDTPSMNGNLSQIHNGFSGYPFWKNDKPWLHAPAHPKNLNTGRAVALVVPSSNIGDITPSIWK